MAEIWRSVLVLAAYKEFMASSKVMLVVFHMCCSEPLTTKSPYRSSTRAGCLTPSPWQWRLSVSTPRRLRQAPDSRAPPRSSCLRDARTGFPIEFCNIHVIALHSLQKIWRGSLVNVRLTKCAELVTALGLNCGVPVAPHQGNKRGQSSSGSSYPITKRQPQEHVSPTATKLRLVSAVWLALAADSNLVPRRSYVRGNIRSNALLILHFRYQLDNWCPRRSYIASPACLHVKIVSHRSPVWPWLLVPIMQQSSRTLIWICTVQRIIVSFILLPAWSRLLEKNVHYFMDLSLCVNY